MIANLIGSEKLVLSDNFINQIVTVFAGMSSNAATLKFISQMQTGNVLDAVFTGSTPEGKGVISFNGKKVVVELPKTVSYNKQQDPNKPTRLSLNNGQAIKVRIENSGLKPTLKIISPELYEDQHYSLETKTSLTPRSKSFSRLTRFENFSQRTDTSKSVINAQITHIVDFKTLIVDTGIGNIVVSAENTESLKPGAQVNVSFEKTEKGQIPNLVKDSTNNAKQIHSNILKPYLPARMPLVKMVNLVLDQVLYSPVMRELQVSPDFVARLKDTLQLFVPKKGKLPSEGKVRQQVESSGINFEAKVRKVIESDFPDHKLLATDLKGLLLKLDQSIAKISTPIKNSGPFTEFRQTIKFAIDNIELNQLSSQVSKQENQPLVIQIPNPLTSGNKTIQLYVRTDSSENEGNDKNKKNGHNVAFILELTSLGKIKISAQISQERLTIKIHAENKAIANYINSKAKDFEQKMNEHNIETSVECSATDKVKPEIDSLIELLVSQNTSLVNIKT